MTTNPAGPAGSVGPVVDMGAATPLPRTVETINGTHHVVAAVHVPAQRGRAAAHIVIYHHAGRSFDIRDVLPNEAGFAVASLIQLEDTRGSYLGETEGTFDLTYAQALQELVDRVDGELELP